MIEGLVIILALIFSLDTAFYVSNIDILLLHNFSILILILLYLKFVVRGVPIYFFILFNLSLLLRLLGIPIEFLFSFVFIAIGTKINASFQFVFTLFIFALGLYYLQFLTTTSVYIVERQFIERIITYNDVRLISSNLFGNSNGSGAAYSSMLVFWRLTKGNMTKLFNIVFLVIISFLIFISHSNAASVILILVILDIIFNNNGKRTIVLLSFISSLIFSLILLHLDDVSISVRLVRIREFFIKVFLNPIYAIIPRINFGKFYTESTGLDLYLNYGLLAVPLIYRLLKLSYIMFFILFFTNSVFTPFPALIFGILLGEKNSRND